MWLRAIAGLLVCGGALVCVNRWQAQMSKVEFMSTPPASTLKATVAGFENIVADGLYLQFVFYFGKHLRSRQGYHNILPALLVTTALDPHFEGAYQMGSLALGDSGDAAGVQQLWTQGIMANATRWEYWYQGGLNLFLFGSTPKEYLQAARWFHQAAALPGSPPEARYMEARMYDVTNRGDLSRALWVKLYERSGSREQRQVAARALKRMGFRVGGS